MIKRLIFVLEFFMLAGFLAAAEKNGDINSSSKTSQTLYEQGLKAQQAGQNAEAFKLYQKSADLGNSSGEQTLGWCYWNAVGVERNYNKAVEWFKKSANQGDAGGEYGLGAGYDYGLGIKQNFSEAFKWYQKSADQGNAFGEMGMGRCYFTGQGVSKDFAKAVEWYKKSADQGNDYGEYGLGYCYQIGAGVAQDQVQAKHLYQLATAQNNEFAKKALATLGDNSEAPSPVVTAKAPENPSSPVKPLSLKEQMTSLVAEYQWKSWDQDLSIKIIKLSHKVKPLKPEDYERYTIRGRAAMKEAKEIKDYDAAVEEYQKAVKAAPWLGTGYFNLGVAEEKAGHLEKALQHFKLYLVASPSASDAKKVKSKIYELEYKQEKRRNIDGKWGNVPPENFESNPNQWAFEVTNGGKNITFNCNYVSEGENNIDCKPTVFNWNPPKCYIGLERTNLSDHSTLEEYLTLTLDEDGKIFSGFFMSQYLFNNDGKTEKRWPKNGQPQKLYHYK